MKQIIVFIHPPFFLNLLGDVAAERIGFSLYDEDDEDYKLLNNWTHIFYVNGPNDYQSAPFKQELAERAKSILVPDDYLEFDNYVPKCEFAVLYHNQTEKNRDITIWRKYTDYFRGDRHSNELPGTPYDVIAKQISNNAPSVDSLWEDLTISHLYSSRERFVVSIMEASDLRDVPLPPIFANKKSAFDNFATNVDFKFDSSDQKHGALLAEFKENLLS
jgi:hypothetical protein